LIIPDHLVSPLFFNFIMSFKPFFAAVAVTVCCIGNDYPAKAFDLRSQSLPQLPSLPSLPSLPGSDSLSIGDKIRVRGHFRGDSYIDDYDRSPRRNSDSYYPFD
jgi:hypothetical protein